MISLSSIALSIFKFFCTSAKLFSERFIRACIKLTGNSDRFWCPFWSRLVASLHRGFIWVYFFYDSKAEQVVKS